MKIRLCFARQMDQARVKELCKYLLNQPELTPPSHLGPTLHGRRQLREHSRHAHDLLVTL